MKFMTMFKHLRYPDTLAKIHGWTVKTAVGMAFSACPHRKDFIKTLG